MPVKSSDRHASGTSGPRTQRIRLNLPRPCQVEVADDGRPLRIDGRAVEGVRERWLIDEGWWTDTPRAPPLHGDRARRRPAHGGLRGPALRGLVPPARLEPEPEPMPTADLPYAELHCHSTFSFLDGASQPEELALQAAEARPRGARADRSRQPVRRARLRTGGARLRRPADHGRRADRARRRRAIPRDRAVRDGRGLSQPLPGDHGGAPGRPARPGAAPGDARGAGGGPDRAHRLSAPRGARPRRSGDRPGTRPCPARRVRARAAARRADATAPARRPRAAAHACASSPARSIWSRWSRTTCTSTTAVAQRCRTRSWPSAAAARSRPARPSGGATASTC